MTSKTVPTTAALLKAKEESLLKAWMGTQIANIALRLDRLSEKDLRQQAVEFLRAFIKAISSENLEDITAPEYDEVNAMLTDVSRLRAAQGFTPSETATYVFSLKDSILAFLQQELGDQPDLLNREVSTFSRLLDKLGLATFETYATAREELIYQQSQAILELSTPVIRIWERIVMLPLVGTIDTPRAQQMVEGLLQGIVDTESVVALLDITGVPMVDTQVAGHLLKAIQAANMLGAQVILTGISPHNAQTLVKLGVALPAVISRGTLRAGLEEAFRIVGLRVTRVAE